MAPNEGTREFSPFSGRLHGTFHEPKTLVACFISLTGVNTMAWWLGRKERSDVRELTTARVHRSYFHSLGIVSLLRVCYELGIVYIHFTAILFLCPFICLCIRVLNCQTIFHIYYGQKTTIKQYVKVGETAKWPVTNFAASRE